ncbi:DUF4256 domain-containing protein [Chryseobacterium sp. FH2]|uniref:DUF4256 domain-containing protein n=1 Tax=Chryseobacterium sp. FH2 TaxID=1674291 RepID=UPI000A6C0357|nr:DUF4256 domain-containing protein [Chryseobacterium sp. FH2]
MINFLRELGGTVFCGRRYNTVFMYHNGADSYIQREFFEATKSLNSENLSS